MNEKKPAAVRDAKTPRKASAPRIAKAPAAAAGAVAPAAIELPVAAVEAVARAVPAPREIAETIEAAVSPADPTETASDAPFAEPPAPAMMMEGLTKMATMTNETMSFAPEKVQALMGDLGTRFKAGVEKSSKLGEEMVDLAKGNVEAVVASARVAAKGGEAFGQEAAEYGKKNLETIVAMMKSVASVKSPTELFQLQSDFAKAQFDSAVAEASRVSESMMKLAGDVAQPLSTRYAVAAEKIKAVAL